MAGEGRRTAPGRYCPATKEEDQVGLPGWSGSGRACKTVGEVSVPVPTGRGCVRSPEKRRPRWAGHCSPCIRARQWKKEVANTGDACENHGQPSTRCWNWKDAFRNLGVWDKGSLSTGSLSRAEVGTRRWGTCQEG